MTKSKLPSEFSRKRVVVQNSENIELKQNLETQIQDLQEKISSGFFATKQEMLQKDKELLRLKDELLSLKVDTIRNDYEIRKQADKDRAEFREGLMALESRMLLKLESVTRIIEELKITTGQEILRLNYKIDKVADRLGITVKDLYMAMRLHGFSLQDLILKHFTHVESKFTSVKDQISGVESKLDDHIISAKLTGEQFRSDIKIFKIQNETRFKTIEVEFDSRIKSQEYKFQRQLDGFKEEYRQTQNLYKDVLRDISNLELEIEKVGVDNKQIKAEASALIREIISTQDALFNNMMMAEYKVESISSKITDRIKDKLFSLRSTLHSKEIKLLKLDFKGREQALKTVNQRLELENKTEKLIHAKKELATRKAELATMERRFSQSDFDLYNDYNLLEQEVRGVKKKYSESKEKYRRIVNPHNLSNEELQERGMRI